MAADYHDLHRYSVENYTFWLDLWEFLGVISSIPPNPKQVRLLILLSYLSYTTLVSRSLRKAE
jgi:hypothetical protein